ncbi:MAG: hypothetical protein CR997_09130 [Acidobacteria bacterium]|nr:MAG: hypothetical protein CR997_09130 [Acidobacteriota bacterium]
MKLPFHRTCLIRDEFDRTEASALSASGHGSAFSQFTIIVDFKLTHILFIQLVREHFNLLPWIKTARF